MSAYCAESDDLLPPMERARSPISALGDLSIPADSCVEYARQYLRYVSHLLDNLDFEAMERIARVMEKAREDRR